MGDSKFKPVKRRDIIKFLKKTGKVKIIVGSNHDKIIKFNGEYVSTLPRHKIISGGVYLQIGKDLIRSDLAKDNDFLKK